MWYEKNVEFAFRMSRISVSAELLAMFLTADVM